MRHLCFGIALVLLVLTPAQAGVFDGLFSAKQDNATATESGQAKPGFFETLFAKKQDGAAKQDSGPPTPMFGGKMMNGGELLGELRTLRATLASPSPMAALSQVLMPPPPAAEAPPPKDAGKAKGKGKSAQSKGAAQPAQAAANKADTSKADSKPQESAGKEKPGAATGKLGAVEAVFNLASKANDLIMNRLSSQLSFQAMDLLFGMLVDQPGTLSKVYVEVPDTSKMNPDLRKRVLNLAAFLVALKACGLVVEASQKDFDAAKESYKKIMAIRQKSAQILADAYFKRNQAESLKQADAAQGTMSLRPQDEALLQQLGGASAEDFVKDPRVQALAVELLRQSDPATYGKYQLEFVEMKSHYNGYARGMTGVAGMIGFTAIFSGQAATLINKQGLAGGLNFLPLLQQALPECVALAPRLVTMFMSGDESVSGSFSIERGGKVEKRGLSAQKVYSALDDSAKKTMREEIATNGPTGLLASLHLVDPAAAAALADKIVKKDTKALLAKHYAAEQQQFSFVDAQAGKCGSPKAYKNISQGLFFQRMPEPDKACTGETGEQVLMLAQHDLREGISSLENSDLRKLMYALNSNPADASAPLVLADMRVRIDNLGIDGLIDQQAMLENRMKIHATERSYAREAEGKRGLKRKHK